jgi:type II secretory pathway component PulF
MEQASRPHVELTGYDAQGRPLTAPVPADGDPTAVQESVLRGGGRVVSSRWFDGDRSVPKGISAEEYARFNEMLALAVRRGVPMLEGLRRLSLTFRSGAFNVSLQRVSERLRRGESLKAAFDPDRARFPRLYGALLEAGAAAGSLSDVLLGLSRNIRADNEFRRAILQSCIYPWFLIIVAAWMLTGFMTNLIPRYALIAPQISVRLPWLLGGGTEGFPAARLAVAVLLVLVFLVLLWSALMRFRVGRPLAEMAARHVPLFRGFYMAAAWSAYADTLALLLRARTPMPRALRLAGPATGVDWLAGLSEQLAEEVESGRSPAEAAGRIKGFPPRMVHAFEAGEAESEPAKALEAMATRYRRESERRVRAIVRYLPAALSVVLGLMVFAVAMLVLGPFFKMWGGAW